MTLEEFVKSCKTQHEAAKVLRCSQGMVSNWLTGRNKITSEKALEIECLTENKVTRYDLRPDVFGVKNDSSSQCDFT